MNAFNGKPNTIPWPPLIYLSAALIAYLLGRSSLAAMTLPGGPILLAAGILLIGAGLIMDLWAARTLVKADTTVLPHRGSRCLVTSGPFRWSRNPIYLGNTLLLTGIGLATGNGWFVIMAIAAALVIQKLAIEREEQHLRALFGEDYEAYCRTTRRWI